jgi:hypothetical protein
VLEAVRTRPVENAVDAIGGDVTHVGEGVLIVVEGVVVRTAIRRAHHRGVCTQVALQCVEAAVAVRVVVVLGVAGIADLVGISIEVASKRRSSLLAITTLHTSWVLPLEFSGFGQRLLRFESLDRTAWAAAPPTLVNALATGS